MYRDYKIVSDCIEDIPAFAYQSDTIRETFEKIKKYKLTNLIIVDRNKKIQGNISRNELRKNVKKLGEMPISTILSERNFKKITTFPTSFLSDAIHVMKLFGINFLPVCNDHLDQQFIGIVKFKEYENLRPSIVQPII